MKDKVSFKAVVGSQNYNLITKYSDSDVKIFKNPTFDDLYYGDKRSIGTKSAALDTEMHDIRKLPNLLYKANVNFTEVLFSTRVETNDDLYFKLKPLRNDIARMNLPHLYEACRGMFKQKHFDFKRDTNYVNVNEWLTDEYYLKLGKTVSNAYRPFDFLKRFEATSFNDFFSAINYKDNDSERKFILSLKNGELRNESELENILEEKYKELETYKEKYYTHKVDEELNLHVQQIVKDHIKGYLKEEL